MNVVIFKVNHLGDNLVFLPVVQALRARFPDWHLTLITTPAEAPMYERIVPSADLFTAPKQAFDKCWKRPWELAAWWTRVRGRRPDACLISFDQANVPHWLARSSGAAVRIGGNLQHIRFRGSLTHEVPATPGRRPAEWNWEMARTLTRLVADTDLGPTPPPPDISHLVGKSARPTRPRILVHAGTSRPLTRWAPDRFAEVASRLARDFDVVWVDRPETAGTPLATGITRVSPVTLRELITLTDTADLFLGNNSGPMHVANALGKAGVVITGAQARGWDPYSFQERWSVLRHPSLPCQPCEPSDKMVLTCANRESPLACLDYWTVDAVEKICRETWTRVYQTGKR